jgi:hypothetical protein
MKNESPALFVHIAITCLIGTLVVWISYGIFFKKADTSKQEFEENQSIIAKQINDLKNQLSQLGINKDNVDKIAKEKEDLLTKAKGDLELAKTKAGGLKTDYELAKTKAKDLLNNVNKSIADLKVNYGLTINKNEGPPVSYDPGPSPSLNQLKKSDLSLSVGLSGIFGPVGPILYLEFLNSKRLVGAQISWEIAKKACDKFNEFEKSEVLKKARTLYEDAEKLVSNTQNLAEETKIALSNAQEEVGSAKSKIQVIQDNLTNEENELNKLLARLPKIENWKVSVINVINYLEIPNLLFSLSLFIVSLTRTFIVLGWFGTCSV